VVGNLIVWEETTTVFPYMQGKSSRLIGKGHRLFFRNTISEKQRLSGIPNCPGRCAHALRPYKNASIISCKLLREWYKASLSMVFPDKNL
jgi:hypothetical protein